jgi:hypothetical protein
VLQYDVEVAGWAMDEKKYSVEAEEDDDDDDYILDNGGYGILDGVEYAYSKRRGQDKVWAIFADGASIEQVVKAFGSLLESRREVAFAMQHLYRRSSILPAFLKGADSQLYTALVDRFDVTLFPVVLHGSTDGSGKFGTFFVHRNDYPPTDESKPEEVRKAVEKEKGIFHIPESSAIEQISYEALIEYTGNA